MWYKRQARPRQGWTSSCQTKQPCFTLTLLSAAMMFWASSLFFTPYSSVNGFLFFLKEWCFRDCVTMVYTSCIWGDRTGKRKQCKEGEKQSRNPAFSSSMRIVQEQWAAETKTWKSSGIWRRQGTFHTVHRIGLQWVHLEKKGKNWPQNGHTQTNGGLAYTRRRQLQPELSFKFLLKLVN